MNKQLYKLKGKIQHYQWGGYEFLPQLLNIANSERKPFAEYWLGAHDNASSVIEGTEPALLNEYIRQNPQVLGETVQKCFGKLPYLLKVLDVKDMLSIQVHPAKEAAKVEFENENRNGIALNAPNRNYKDDNHKPELMVALSDFWLLHGFRKQEEIIALTRTIPEFSYMFPLLEEGGYKALYQSIMEEDQDRVNRRMQPLLDRIIPEYQAGRLQKNDPHFWAARAALTFNEHELFDRGIFSIYLLNLVHLKPGEAIFQDAGVLHAYLEGQNMEIMANSDNVLRGGLTPKHIDVAELMKHVRFQAHPPQVIKGTKAGEHEEVFTSPAPDFELSKITLAKNEVAEMTCITTEIFIVTSGIVLVKEKQGQPLRLTKGEAAVAFDDTSLTFTAEEHAEVYRASAPEAGT